LIGTTSDQGAKDRHGELPMVSFDKAEVVHEGRASNLDAHRLARSSIYEDKENMFSFCFLPMEFVPTLLMFK
jgi:hypothetical protein